MGISIAIDAANYDQKTQEKYCKIFERILGIKESSDEVNFFYISKLQELIKSYDSDKYQMLQHFFGLDGYKEKDLGSLAQMIKCSFISDVILVIDELINELKANRELYDARLLILHYVRKIDKERDDLAQLKKAVSAKYVKSNIDMERKYKELIAKTEKNIENAQIYLKKIEKEYHLAKKAYKKYA